MKIALFSQYSFPFGGAASNRILAYCKALTLNSTYVKVYIPFQTDYQFDDFLPDDGNYNGINYQYTFKRYRSKYKSIRGLMRLLQLDKLLACITFIKSFIRDNKKIKYDTLIFSTDTFLYLLIGMVLKKIFKTKVIFIFDEYPIPIRHELKDRIPKWKERAYAFILRDYTAYISISNTLRKYFQDISHKPCFIMPVIVDHSKFEFELESSNDQSGSLDYLCYMGNFELAKDNVDLIVKAFSLVHQEYPTLKLFLYGDPKHLDREKVIYLINKLELKNFVILKGFIKSTEVPKILFGARVLVSSQPDTKRAKGGFPTKLAEYMMTGKPTLLTDVGENSIYVNKDEHCFMVPPNDPVIYAEKLKWILNNYEKALSISKNGKKFIIDNYSSLKIGQKLVDFFEDL